MLKNKAILVLASALLAMPGAIQAQGVTPTAAGKGGTVSADQLVQRYVTFAGGPTYGPANAKSLVNGLRTGADITLTGAPTAGEPIYGQVQVGIEHVQTGTRTDPVYGMRPCPPPAAFGTLCKVQVGTVEVPIYEDRPVYEKQQVGTTPGQPSTVTFSPGAATPMGFGNVDIALALTEARLRPNAAPTPSQLKDALLEILQKRAGGAGWGEIANAYGFQLK